MTTRTILITVDALRASRLSQYGASRDPMPVLDSLTSEGTVFLSAFANAPYTALSVPAMLTSKNIPWDPDTGLTIGEFLQENKQSTVASKLSKNGVITGMVGTRTGFTGGTQFSGGFDYVSDLEKKDPDIELNDLSILEELFKSISYNVSKIPKKLEQRLAYYRLGHNPYFSAEEVTDEAINWIESNYSSDFFLWIHYMEGHRPCGVHHKNHKYCKDKIGDNEILKLNRKAGTRPKKMSVDDHFWLTNLYDSNLAYCSDHISRLFGKMRTLSIFDDTNVIFTSDHGEEFYDHGMYFHRNLPYDELLRVPLIFKKSGGNQRDKVNKQRELLDIAPTIIGEHDVSIRKNSFEGKHLLNDEDRRVISLGCGYLPNNKNVVAVRDKGWKYIHVAGEHYLFNIDENKSETNDVSDKNQKKTNELFNSIPTKFFGETATRPEPTSQENREQLEALGYMEVE
jgi:arylsulfatase A-like enzyme